MRILLTGSNGQVGFELQRSLAPLGELVAVNHATCDLADPAALRDRIRSVQPDVIVNSAAYTAVDRAESDVDRAFSVNTHALGIIGEEAARSGARVIHYSTDYVFNGEKEGAYTETDSTNPLSVYGCSKLAGEQALAISGADHLILRTSWVVGAHGSNFAKGILRLAAERDTLNVVADQYGAPTSASLIADVTAHVLRDLSRNDADKPAHTIFHLAAGGRTTWHEYAAFVVKAGLEAGLSLKLKPENIIPIPAAEYPAVAHRPQNSHLATKRLCDRFGLVLPDWRKGVHHVLQQLF